VTSTDASDKMLKYAMKERWNRRIQPAFDNWGKPNILCALFSEFVTAVRSDNLSASVRNILS